MLTVSNVSKGYGGRTLFSDLSLQFNRQDRLGLVGPNGAGKSTCFNLLTKFLPPTRGVIRYEGRDITGMKAA